ncbi:MAG: putative anti-sigma regulatory factor, serine/threonine protein kinase [Clostridiales bacterium]|nr:putative anti-sigma regulatory factor, serine/threonine protein kinase [Clostridiales bacterium]
MNDNSIKLNYKIPYDLAAAGEASSSVKKVLLQLGADHRIVKRAAIAMYEAEINAVIHAGGGRANVIIDQASVIITIQDEGPGIPDIELAMQEGYSTAPDHIREMGFGAGMGLSNMKRYSDNLKIESEVGKGTTVSITVYIKN